MKLLVISHKETWPDPASRSGYATIGGFPFQMQALSELFDETTVMVPIRDTPRPAGARPLTGPGLRIHPLPEPAGTGLRRKMALLAWLPRHLSQMRHAVRQATAVHAAVPGDIGTLGILLALAQHKPLFVRHCGTWGEPVTVADRFLLWLLERIAGGRTVVMATGGGAAPPSPRNRDISWIFSTSLSEAELEQLPPSRLWRAGEPLRLATVSRLTTDKNTIAVLEALPLLVEAHPRLHLDVAGEGPRRRDLETRAAVLDVADHVTFHGNVSHADVLRILGRAHLFVFPTRTKEGFPKAVLEALACGLPVVATGVSVLPHLIGTKNGRVLKNTNPEAVAEAILVLTADEQRWAAMAAHARTTSRAYTLERWRAVIGERLRERWGPLKQAQRAGAAGVKAVS